MDFNMRLDNRRESSNIEDNRYYGQGKKIGGFSIVGLIIAAVYSYLSGDSSYFMREVTQQVSGSMTSQSTQHTPTQAEEKAAVFTSKILASTEDVWGDIFKKYGYNYPQPKLVLFRDQVRSACGVASAQTGPFYCSGDKKVYIDLSFVEEMKRLGASGDFAFAYVIAHEVGHHISNVTGILPKVHKAQQQTNQKRANQLSVLLELQADCYAGVWGHYADKYQNILGAGDVEEGIRAAKAVGDDTLTKGQVSPDNFTHGTAKQRMQWFMHGMKTGKVGSCDTFKQAGVNF